MESLYLLIGFLLMTQFGKYLFFDISYVGGLPVDYLSLSFFVSEFAVSILGMRLLWLHKERLTKKPIAIILLFLGYLLATSQNIQITTFELVSLLAPVLIGLIFFSAKPSWLKAFARGLAIGGVVQLFLVVYQVFIGTNLGGLAYWLGERELSFGISRVARFTFFGIERLRPYGTFSHPNSMAGFAIVVFWLYRLVFDTKDRWNRLASWMWLSCGILSLSKAGIFALVVSLGVYYWRVKVKWLIVLSFLISAVTMVAAYQINASNISFIDERFLYIRATIEVIKNQPLFGSGLGNFIPSAFKTSSEYAHKYSYQPVHNIWFLIAGELGTVGITIALFMFWKFGRYLDSAKLTPVISVILITGLFDHYWLTLTQNRLLIGIVIGLLLRENIKDIWRTVKESQ